MEKVKSDRTGEKRLEKQAENCSRLDENCCLDGGAVLVKKQYGKMDDRRAMDQGMMLQ